jgi:hypothetical protein
MILRTTSCQSDFGLARSPPPLHCSTHRPVQFRGRFTLICCTSALSLFTSSSMMTSESVICCSVGASACPPPNQQCSTRISQLRVGVGVSKEWRARGVLGVHVREMRSACAPLQDCSQEMHQWLAPGTARVLTEMRRATGSSSSFALVPGGMDAAGPAAGAASTFGGGAGDAGGEASVISDKYLSGDCSPGVRRTRGRVCKSQCGSGDT